MKPCRAATAVMLLLLLPACGKGEYSLRVAGETRTYQRYVPANIEPNQPLPLLLVLHPFTGTGRSIQRETGFDALAEEEGFIVAYPDGRGRRWDTESGGGEGELRFLLALIDTLESEFPVDPARIYVTGASAGGIMAQYLACRTDRIAAFASVMAALPQDLADRCQPGRACPALLIHGTADPVIPYEGGITPSGPGRTTNFLSVEENAAWWAENNGCTAPPAEVPVPGTQERVMRIEYECPADAPVQLYKILGGGHTWPGGSSVYPEFITGPTETRLNASRTIWEFFNARQ